MAARPSARCWSVAGREVAVSNPARCTSPRPASRSSTSCATTSPSPRARCAAPAGGRTCSSATPNGIDGEFFYQKRAPASRPDWIEVVALQLPVGPHGGGGRAARRRRARLDGEPRLPRAASAPGARRGPRSPRRAARRPRPGARRRVAADPGGGARGARGARRPRPRRLAEDVGLARHPRQRAHRPPLDVHAGAARGARARARGRAARAGARHQQVVEGGAPRRLPRLQPERQGPHGRGRLLGAAEARRARLGAGHVGRARRVPARGLHAAHDAGALRRVGDRHAGIDDEPRLARRAARAVGAAGSRGPRRRAVAAALREAGGRAAARAAVAAGRGAGPAGARRPKPLDRDRPRREEGRRARRARALEGAPSRGGRAPRAGRRPRRRDARPLVDLDARPREPRARAGGAAAGAGAARSRLRSVGAALTRDGRDAERSRRARPAE